MKIEQRFAKMPVEIREKQEGKQVIGGRAIPYGEESEDMGFFEVIERGAFDESIKDNTIKSLWSHDSSKVLGSTANGTLELEDREDGLYFENDLPDTQVGRDAKVLIERGDVDGVSFGFFATEVLWNDADPSHIVRTIKKGELIEISPVAFPAYSQSDVSIRSAYEEYKKNQKPPVDTRWLEKEKIKLMEVEL